MSKATQAMSEQPLFTVGNATIVDAFVDFNFGNASPGQLYIEIDESIDREQTFYPVEDDADADRWLAEGDGLFELYEEGPIHPPADEAPKTTTVPVEHTNGSTRDMVPSFHHEADNTQSRRKPFSVLSARFENGYLTSYPIRVELAQAIINQYINGPLGSDTTSHCWNTREIEREHRWSRLSVASRDDVEPYATADVELVPDKTYNWKVVATRDLDTEPTFDYTKRFYAVIRDQYSSPRTVFDVESDAVDYVSELDGNYSVKTVEFDNPAQYY